MMNVFEKIREKLEDAKSWEDIDGKPRFTFRDEHILEIAIQIVNKVEQEHNNGWIPFECREADKEEKEYLGRDIESMMCCKLPEGDEEILVTYGDGSVGVDIFLRDGYECYLDSGAELVTEAVAWKHLPQPYKERDTNGL